MTQEPEQSIITLLQKLVEQLKQNGSIKSPFVESAFLTVPRHVFVPDTDLEMVYSDSVIVTKRDMTDTPISSSSQPSIMAIMLEQLDLKPGQRILEIGAGTGYNAALIAHLVGETGQVITIDIDEDIVQNAREHLAAAGVTNVKVIQDDGIQGYLPAAPYDRIILTVSAWDVAPVWVEQLKADGRLVLPLVVSTSQVCVAFDKVGNHLESQICALCGFMPLRGALSVPSSLRAEILPGKIQIWGDISDKITKNDIYRVLNSDYQDIPVGIQMKAEWEGFFWAWIPYQERNFFTISVQGIQTDSSPVPYFKGEPGVFRLTCGLLSKHGMAVVMLPPNERVLNEDQASLFPIYIRHYGDDPKPALRLIKQLKAWNNSGRPMISEMQIHLYPIDAAVTTESNEVIIPKRWNKLIIGWKTSS